MSDTNPPHFLDLQSYRHKRLIDAARIFPLLAVVVLLFPLPFLFADDASSVNGLPLAIYLFSVWLILILAALILSRRMSGPKNDSED